MSIVKHKRKRHHINTAKLFENNVHIEKTAILSSSTAFQLSLILASVKGKRIIERHGHVHN